MTGSGIKGEKKIWIDIKDPGTKGGRAMGNYITQGFGAET